MSSTFSKFFAVFVKYWVLHGHTSYFLQVFYLQFAPKDRILESYITDLGVTLYDENLGVDHDFIVTNITKTAIKGKLTDRIGDFGRDYRRGKEIEYSKGSIAYNEAKLIKESDKNATARGNKERKEMSKMRNALDKAGIKYPAGSGLENLRIRYNSARKLGKIK